MSIYQEPMMKPLKTLLLAAALLPLCAAAQTTVTFAGFGGPLQEAMVKQMFADAPKLNIRIKEDRNGFWAGVKANLLAKAPGWDVTEIGFARCEQAAQANLIQDIDYAVVDKSKVPANLAQPKYIGVYTFSYGLTYQTKKYGANGPKSWADFFDVQKFPGRRTMIGDGLYALEIALIADGVAAKDVYQTLRTPAGVDRAFAKLEKIKPHIAVWYKSSGQATQLMRDGEVDMGLIANARALSVIKEGTPLTFVWNQAFIDTECLMVPNAAQNGKAAMQLINSALDPANQAAFAVASAYGPTNLKAFDTKSIPASAMEWLPSAPQNLPQQIWADQRWYASPEAEAAMARFSKFLQ
jgi:putative spermidine/putrescine transport system substrate-binding protein